MEKKIKSKAKEDVQAAASKSELRKLLRSKVAAPIEIAKQVTPELEKKELRKKVVKKKTEPKPEAKAPEIKPEEIAESKPAEIKQELAPCEDKRCALHGGLKIRGRIFIGKVVSDKRKNTVRIEWPRQCYVPKYERYEKRRSRVHAHNPPCISAKLGDVVKIAECRPLAKTVNFVVVEKVK